MPKLNHEISIGIVTDSHSGEYDDNIVDKNGFITRKGIVGFLKEKADSGSLDAIVFNGDAPSDISAPTDAHFLEICRLLAIYDKIGIPVFWLPGNYEDYFAYNTSFRLKDESLENVIDVSTTGKCAFNGYDLIFVPGSREFSRGFRVYENVKTGVQVTAQQTSSGTGYNTFYNFNPADLLDLVKVENPDRTVIFTHNPPSFKPDKGAVNRYSIDLAVNAQDDKDNMYAGLGAHQFIREGKAKPVVMHAGNEYLAFMCRRLGIRYLFSGDIHEAAGMITDINGNPIREGVYSPQLFATPGAALDGNYGIATFRDDGTASFTRYNVTGMKVDYVNDLILNFR